MKKLFFILIYFSSLNCLHSNIFPTFSYMGTAGSNNYWAHSITADFDLSLGLYLEANYNFSNSSYRNYYFSGGRVGDKISFNLFGGVTPEFNGYKNHSIGFDGSVQILSLDGYNHSKNDPFKIYLLLGFNRIMHTDGQTIIQTRSHNRLIKITENNNIDENDFTGGIKLKYKKTFMATKFTKSGYEQKTFQTSKAVNIIGVSAYQQGYPDQTLYLKLNHYISSMAYIYGSYSNVKYKFGDSDSANSFITGVGVNIKLIDLKAEYNRYIPSFGGAKNYYSFGISLSFF